MNFRLKRSDDLGNGADAVWIQQARQTSQLEARKRFCVALCCCSCFIVKDGHSYAQLTLLQWCRLFLGDTGAGSMFKCTKLGKTGSMFVHELVISHLPL